MTDKRADLFKNTNVSPSTGKAYSNRFDYDGPNVQPSKHDVARDAYLSLSAARRDCLRFWSKYALHRQARRVGWTYNDEPTGGITIAQLANEATLDCGFDVSTAAMAGAALLEGIGPVFSSAHKPHAEWIVPAYYEAVPANLQTQFNDLKAAAA